MSLELKNVEKKVGLDTHIYPTNLRFEKNTINILLGSTLAGKTTLMQIMAGLHKPTNGEIWFNEKNVTGVAVQKRNVSMVYQQFINYPNFTVFDNIASPLKITGISSDEIKKKVIEVSDLLKLSEMLDKKPNELSGGQQQRVGIARSLAVEPDIWFLDEPFSALDPLIRKEMQDEFLRLQGVLNKTIMYVTHDFDEALRLADRIAIMKDGIIEQLDTPDNIVLNPATEYVKKFTEDVPREKVLKIESIMDAYDSNNSSSAKVSKDAIIETLAESILNSKEILTVVDNNNEIVGSLNPTKVIKVIFGK